MIQSPKNKFTMSKTNLKNITFSICKKSIFKIEPKHPENVGMGFVNF